MRYVDLFAAMDFTTILIDCCRSEKLAPTYDVASSLAGFIHSAGEDEEGFRQAALNQDQEEVKAAQRLALRLLNHYKDKQANAAKHERLFGTGEWDRKMVDQLAEFVMVLRDCLRAGGE